LRTLLDLTVQSTTEFWVERGLVNLRAVAPNLPPGRPMLGQISSWCARLVDAYSPRMDIRSDALALLLFCAAHLGTLEKDLRVFCSRNPDVFHDALYRVHHDHLYGGSAVWTLAAARRAVDDWLTLCPPQRWNEPASVQECVQKLRRQAERWLPPEEVEPFVRTVLGYFTPPTPHESAGEGSALFLALLECLYSTTGRQRQYGKWEPQLLEEA
jgi:hypothetical protein